MQFEFGFLLGPPDGRYLIRPAEGAEPENVIVLGTLGAPERRRLRSKRPRRIDGGEPEPVPTQRATLIQAQALPSPEDADRRLEELRRDEEARAREVAAATRSLNAVVRAWRAAASDPFARDCSPEHALVVRIGYGKGGQVADGRFSAAYELPPREPRRRIERLEPQERFASLLGAREPLLACEELVMRARSDLAAARFREAALQARVALEAVLAELSTERAGEVLAELEGDRRAVGEAANVALEGEPDESLRAAVEEAVERMERALRRHRDPRRAG